MGRGETPERSDSRWMFRVAALVFVAAALAVSWALVTARRPPHDAPGRSAETIADLIEKRRLPEAETLARAALTRARAGRPASMQAADAMDALVTVLTAAGQRDHLAEARALAQESVRIRETACGGDCPELAASLSAEASLLWRFEDYRAALPVAERAAALRTRLFGPRHPLVAESLYSLAEAHRALGNFAAAEGLHRQAVAIWQASPGGDDRGVASSLHYLGVIHWTTGDVAGAREYFERSLAMRERANASETDAAASDIYSLGSLAVILGERDKALALFNRAQAVWEKTLGSDDPHVARTLSSKGELLAAAGDFAAAKALLQRALAIRVRSFGEGHYLVARSLADLGRLAVRAGERAEAERLLAEALEIQRKDPQGLAPDLASTLIEDAELALVSGDRARSVDLSLQAETIARGHFLRTSRGLGEQEALRYERVRGSGLDIALSALLPEEGCAPALSGAAARVWDELIRSRAMVLDEMAARQHPVSVAAGGQPGLAEVAQRLPAATALVGFVKYVRHLRPPGEPTPSYLALVIAPGGASGGSRPSVVPLGPAAAIDESARRWRAEAGTDPRLELHSEPGPDAPRRYLEAARHLRRAIWDPVAPLLEGRRMVFVVPDGTINLVSLAALARDDGRYLIESAPSMHYLSAERDIAAPHPYPGSGRGVLVVGGVDFDAPLPPASGGEGGARSLADERADRAAGHAAGASADQGAGEAGPGRSDAPSCGAYREMRFSPLPGSRREIEDIARLWSGEGGVTTLSGPGAVEETLKKQAPGRRIIHLATHGYSLFDRCASALTGVPQPDGLEGGAAVGENPLLLSGLALAGANRRLRLAPEQDDGLLSAAEIGAMDLSGVEWAVLSGCETGLGQVLEGEGVVGLRRAFEVAGAGTLIMSLWPVDDGAARIWMHHLYEGRLSGLSTVEAVNRAGLRMIEAQRAAGASTHPYFWGAFVATGDWR